MPKAKKQKVETVTIECFSGNAKKPFATTDAPKAYVDHLNKIARIVGTTFDVVFAAMITQKILIEERALGITRR